jgi:hypothetical protein
MRWLHNPVDCGPTSLADRGRHRKSRTTARTCQPPARGIGTVGGASRRVRVRPLRPRRVCDFKAWLPPAQSNGVKAPAPGTKIVLAGRFPKARYFSFTLYDARGQPVASAYDAQIDPDRGSASPFRGAASAARGRSLSPPGAVHPAARETGGQHAVREATGGLRRRAAVRDAGLRARRPVASRTLSEPDDRDGRRSRAGGARGVRDDLIDRGRGGWSACKRGG